VHGDLIIAAVAERYGLLGLVGVFCAWAGLVVALMTMARWLKRDRASAALLAGGLTLLLTIQVLTQCGGVFGLMPFTGVPLPWLSQGMSATIALTAVLAVVLAAGGGAGWRAPADERALSRRRLNRMTLGVVVALVVIAGSAVWWMAAAPLVLGSRGASYRWVDRSEVERLRALVQAGVFVRKGGSSSVRVDHAAYRDFSSNHGGAAPLLELMQTARGMRWSKDGSIQPLPYLVSRHNVFADREAPHGWILDRRGHALAMDDADGRRVWPLGAAGVHVVGLPRGATFGMGLEAAAGDVLSGTTLSRAARLRRFVHDIHHGADLVLTLDARVQRSAYELLDGRRGGAVVMDLNDGALLALTSSPAPEPGGDVSWGDLEKAVDRPLRDRAVASTEVYSPPGSTFKMVMAVAAVLSDTVDPDTAVRCDGYDEELQVRCAHGHGHGEVDLGKALEVSCNVYFARLAVALGPAEILGTAERMGFNGESTVDLAGEVEGVAFAVAPSTVELDTTTVPTDSALARVGFGQGPVSATPLAMARAGGVIATGGKLLSPQLIRKVALGRSEPGAPREVVWEQAVHWASAQRVMPRHVARQVGRRLEQVFSGEEGTASGLSRLWHGPEGWRVAGSKPGPEWSQARVAGKTGSSWRTQRDRTDDAWMVAWAPARRPRVITCVAIEDGGSGAAVAGPVAIQLIADALNALENRSLT
jgi:hypothetical protein